MSVKRYIIVFLSILFLGIGGMTTSCKSREAICEANQVYSKKKIKKNKSRYGTKYGYKSKPTRKAYVIRNK